MDKRIPPMMAALLAGVSAGAAEDGKPTIRAATSEEAQPLMCLETGAYFYVGQALELAPWATKQYRWPAVGEVVIVTDVLDVPIRSQDGLGTMASGRRYDIELAFIDDEGELASCLYDSRHFVPAGAKTEPNPGFGEPDFPF